MYIAELELIKNRINRDISYKCANADAYLTLKYGLKKFKKKKDKKTKTLTKILDSDSVVIDKLLKIRGYNKYGLIFTKGFVCIVVDYDEQKEIEQISIKYEVKGVSTKWFYINECFITGLTISLDYFEGI